LFQLGTSPSTKKIAAVKTAAVQKKPFTKFSIEKQIAIDLSTHIKESK